MPGTKINVLRAVLMHDSVSMHSLPDSILCFFFTRRDMPLTKTKNYTGQNSVQNKKKTVCKYSFLSYKNVQTVTKWSSVREEIKMH